MFTVFSYRIRLIALPERTARVEPKPPASHRRRGILVAIAGAVGVSCLSALPAAADSGSVGVTVNIAQISITVSPSTATLTGCSRGNSTPTQLGFPNGQCEGGAFITITNTGAGSHISVEATNAIPADNGTPWSLCTFGGATPCSGPTITGVVAPGTDQFAMTVQSASVPPLEGPQSLSTTLLPDGHFGSGGAAAAGAMQKENTLLYGPQSSTDQSASFSTSITWVAAL